MKFSGFVIPALRTRRAHTGVELRDGQSFALAGLLDNNETRSFSKIPVLGDIPLLGNLFKSSSFQKNESELMFIITAQLVKPVNRDDLPILRGIDGLKTGSPLGVEPKDGGITGKSGFLLIRQPRLQLKPRRKSVHRPPQLSAPAMAPRTFRQQPAPRPRSVENLQSPSKYLRWQRSRPSGYRTIVGPDRQHAVFKRGWWSKTG